MDLKDFVKETLVQISSGVQESIAEVRESGGYTNPAAAKRKESGQGSYFSSMGDGQNVFLVDFDVAVSVDEDSKVSGEGKLRVASVISLGGEAGSSTKSSASNRVSFRVPIALPVDPISFDEVEERRRREIERVNEGHERLLRSLS